MHTATTAKTFEASSPTVISDTVGDDKRESWTLALELAVVGMLVFVSVVFNIIVISACRNKLSKSPNLFLVVLAMMDIFNCLVIAAEFCMKLEYVHRELGGVFGSIKQSVTYFGTAGSSFLVVCITVDRFVRISRSKGGLKLRNSIVMVICSLMVSAIISVPFSLMNYATGQRTDRVVDRILNTTGNYSTAYFVNTSDIVNQSFYIYKHLGDTNKVPNSPSYMLVFHIVVAIQVLLAFFCIITMSLWLIYVLIQNGNRLLKHKKENYDPSNRTSLITQKSSNTPSNTDVSQQPHNNEAMNNDEFKQKLLTTISAQIMERDKYQSRKTSAVIIKSSSKQGSLPRTICLLLLAAFLFLFNLLPVFLNVSQYTTPSFYQFLSSEFVILHDFLRHSYILCFIFNPVLYTFFNRGFEKSLRKACCCIKWQNRELTIRVQQPLIKQRGRITELNPRVWYLDNSQQQTMPYRETEV